MTAIRFVSRTVLLVAAGLALVQASDRTGVYARIDKVVLEPSADSPERIQVWGVFSLATTTDPNNYDAPQRGYLYFKLDGSAGTARAEWNDMKQVAGTAQIVSFGGRGRRPQIRKAADKPENPDPYTTNIGLSKVNGRTDYAPIRALLDFKD